MKRLSLALGFGFSLCLIAGRWLDAKGTIAGGWGWTLLGAAALTPIAGRCFAWLGKRMTSCQPHSPRMRQSRFALLCALAVFAGWLPVFLGLYPGVFSYDVLAQVIQGAQSPYAQNHPLLHTLLLNALLQHGNAGMAAYSLLQMARVVTLHPEWQDDPDVQALF